MSNGAIKRQIRNQERAERERRRRIALGQRRVHTLFERTFTPAFFDRVSSDFLAYYMPHLREQYDDARAEALYQQARQGNVQSSGAASLFGRVARRFGEESARIANEAANARQRAVGQVEEARGNILATLSSTADPAAAVRQSLGAIAAASARPTYAPLPDIFSNLLNTAATFVRAEREGYRGTGTGYFSPYGAVRVRR